MAHLARWSHAYSYPAVGAEVPKPRGRLLMDCFWPRFRLTGAFWPQRPLFVLAFRDNFDSPPPVRDLGGERRATAIRI